MAKEKSKYHMMDANELLEHAKKSAEITDLEERVDIGHKILTGYMTSPKVDVSFLEKSININMGELPKQIFEKFKAKAKEGKKLNDNEQSEFLKKMADIIMPAMGAGADKNDMNYGTMMTYLENAATEKYNPERQVREALAKGDGEKAKQIIVDTLTAAFKGREQTNLIYQLVPKDDLDLHYKLAEKFADKYNKELEEAGIDKKVPIGDVALKIHQHYMERANLAIERKKEYGKLKGGGEQ